MIALAGAAAGVKPAAPAPPPDRTAGPIQAARPVRVAAAPAPRRQSLAASLAISAIPAAAGPPHYVLTGYQARRRHHAPRQVSRRGHYQPRRVSLQRYDTPRQIAWSLLRGHGWARWQFRFLDRLWELESSWNPQAANPYSGAYGIPQAEPAVKMASAGPDWRWSARTQIRWGMRYIRERYGSPFGAWAHECRYGWY